VGERPRPGDDREHGDGRRVRGREQTTGRAHQPSRRPPRPGRPSRPSPPRPRPARPLLPRGEAAPPNAVSLTPGCLLNARPTLTRPAAAAPPAREGDRPGPAGGETPSPTEIGFSGPFLAAGPEISYRRGEIVLLLRERGCTSRVPFRDLSSTCDLPRAASPPVSGRRRRWSAGRRFSRQAPLVSRACDSATRNSAAAVVNSGASAPPAPPGPRQVTSQVMVAVAVNAPPGCPALELA
jgi:hypothetical protein